MLDYKRELITRARISPVARSPAVQTSTRQSTLDSVACPRVNVDKKMDVPVGKSAPDSLSIDASTALGIFSSPPPPPSAAHPSLSHVICPLGRGVGSDA